MPASKALTRALGSPSPSLPTEHGWRPQRVGLAAAAADCWYLATETPIELTILLMWVKCIVRPVLSDIPLMMPAKLAEDPPLLTKTGPPLSPRWTSLHGAEARSMPQVRTFPSYVTQISTRSTVPPQEIVVGSRVPPADFLGGLRRLFNRVAVLGAPSVPHPTGPAPPSSSVPVAPTCATGPHPVPAAVTNRRASACVLVGRRRALPFQPAGLGVGSDGPLQFRPRGPRPERGFRPGRRSRESSSRKSW